MSHFVFTSVNGDTSQTQAVFSTHTVEANKF